MAIPLSNTTQWLKNLRQGFWRGQSFAFIDETLQKLLYAKFYAESSGLLFDTTTFLTIYDQARRDFQNQTTVDIGELPISITSEPQKYRNTIEEIQNVLISADTNIWHLINNLWTERSLRKEDGQYFTPYAIKRFICEIYPPTTSCRVCDPCGGSGGFIIMAADMLPSFCAQHFYYYDADGEKIAKVAQKAFATYRHHTTSHNLLGINTAVHDSLDDVWHCQMDRIYTNVPFGHKLTVTTKDKTGKPLLHSYEVGEGKSSELSQLLFIEKCVNQLSDGGLFATVVDKGVVTNRKYIRERSIIAQKAALELVVELPATAFQYFAGTTFPTFLLFFRKGQPAFTRYEKVKNIGYSATSYNITDLDTGPFDSSLESVNYDNCDLKDIVQRWHNRQWSQIAAPNFDPNCDYPYKSTLTGNWLWGYWKYHNVPGPRLKDVAHLVFTNWNGNNPHNPTVDRKYRYIKESHLKPRFKSKVRTLKSGCLLMSRLLSDSQSPACAIIPDKYHGAGCTNENFIIEADNIDWLMTVWCLINFDPATHEYLWSHCRGQGRARIADEDLLAMPVRDLTSTEKTKVKDLIDSLDKKRWVDEIVEQKLLEI